MDNSDRVTGWWVFAGILLMIVGVLNIIWGIAAIAEAHSLGAYTNYIASSLKTWGWITLILGVFEILAGLSLFAGGSYGRWFAIVVTGLVAIDSLFNIGSSPHPWWELSVFALAVIILYQLAKPAPWETTS